MRGQVNFKLINTTDPIFAPTRKFTNDAGADLRARIDQPIILHPEQIIKIPTGIATGIPVEHVGLVLPRSGASSEGKVALIGAIDSDYRGEIKMSITNIISDSVTIEPKERLAQLVILPCFLADFVQVDELSETDRGQNGFGSTGRFQGMQYAEFTAGGDELVIGLLIYFVIGALIASSQIRKADKLHEKGIMDDAEYLIHRYRKPYVFSYITMFWLPAIMQNFRRKNHDY